MASTPSVVLDIPGLQALMKEAGHMLTNPSARKDDQSSSKNKFEEVVNEADFDVQQFLFEKLKDMHPTHAFVGEEEIDGDCATKFPEPMDPEKYYWTLDPIDGSNNWKNRSSDYAITIGLQKGREPIFGMAYIPALPLIISGGKHWPTMIGDKPVDLPKSYDPDNIRLAFGLGKRKPKKVQQDFMKEIQNVTDEIFRPGCASISIIKVLRGENDAYLSLKEAATNINPWLAILAGTDLKLNIDLATLDQNEPFCLYVATEDFEKEHLKPGSTLAYYLEN